MVKFYNLIHYLNEEKSNRFLQIHLPTPQKPNKAYICNNKINKTPTSIYERKKQNKRRKT